MVLYYSLLAIFVSWTWFNIVLMDEKTATIVMSIVVYQFKHGVILLPPDHICLMDMV